MKKATLIRTESGDQGTFGLLTIEGQEFFTGELPERSNASGVSCIPAGRYRCAWTFSNRFKREMYQVLDVPDRTGIRFHSANFVGDVDKGYQSQVNGCIAVGSGHGTLDGQAAVIGSKAATKRFEDLLGGSPFEIEILDAYDQVPTS